MREACNTAATTRFTELNKTNIKRFTGGSVVQQKIVNLTYVLIIFRGRKIVQYTHANANSGILAVCPTLTSHTQVQSGKNIRTSHPVVVCALLAIVRTVPRGCRPIFENSRASTIYTVSNLSNQKRRNAIPTGQIQDFKRRYLRL